MSGRLAGRAPALLRQGRRIIPSPTPIAARSLTSNVFNSSPLLRLQNGRSTLSQKRLFTSTRLRASTAADAQSPPNSKAYLASGAVKPLAQVNVKKVLVVGSGGLSIGQAGEFDYSGSIPQSFFPLPLC